ncbi:MAG: hypothetical protein ACOCZE_06170 [Planctomycetota bacterium]
MSSRQQISRGQGPAVHRYYDIPAESPDGKSILYFEFDEVIPGPGHVIVADSDGSNPREVGRADGDCTGHVGALQLWLDDRTICFTPSGDVSESSLIVNLQTGEQTHLDGQIRTWDEANRRAIALGRGVRDDTDFGRRQRPVVELWQADTDEFTRLFELEDAAAVHPRAGSIDTARMNFMNAKWAPGGGRFFVVFTDELYARHHSRPRTIKSLMQYRLDAGRPEYLGEFTHHPMWSPDGRFVLAHLDNDRGGQDLVALQAGQSPEILLADYEGVHSSQSADGRRVLTDSFRSDGSGAVLLYDLSDGSVQTLDVGRHEKHGHQAGSHIHPQFSRDLRRIIYNLADTGQPQLCAMSL